MFDLSIIIVSYNTKDILLECLQSVYENLPKNYTTEVIVVDNASEDGTIELIQKSPIRQAQGKNQNYPFENLRIKDNSKLKIIQNKENLGFSKANNIGVKESNGKYILFLNSDTVVYKDTLEEMIKFMDNHSDCGAATCKVKLLDGKLDDASHRGFPTPWNAFCHFLGLSKMFPKTTLFGGYNLGFKELDTIHEIDACAGAFLMAKKEAGEQIGWWDEDFFWYGDDLDFCYRLKQKNWKIYYVPKVSILHYKGVSGGIKKHSENISIATKETKSLATKARFEAMKIFYKKHYQKKYPKIVTLIIMKTIDFKLKIASLSL